MNDKLRVGLFASYEKFLLGRQALSKARGGEIEEGEGTRSSSQWKRMVAVNENEICHVRELIDELDCGMI